MKAFKYIYIYLALGQICGHLIVLLLGGVSLKCQHGRHCDLESNKYFDSWQNALSHLTMGAGILTLASLGRLFWFRGAERTAELRPTGRWKLPCSGYYWHRAISWKLFGWQASFESIFTIPLSSFFIYTLV